MNQSLISYTLHLADDALILAQRNSEWCGHGPVLEQDIAITNISLDLLGQARSLYQYAAELLNRTAVISANEGGGLSGGMKFNPPVPNSPSTGGGWGEDSLAYLRDARDFKNCLLVEQPNGDWAQTILRQFFFSHYQYLLYQQLQQSPDATLAAIAEKSLKEVTYHVRWSSEWVIRLGDGTEESRNRMLAALDELWTYTGELFIPAQYETEVVEIGVGVDMGALKNVWEQKISDILAEATLPSPLGEGQGERFMQTGGKNGIHTEHLGYILAEMQFMQRAYPNSEW